MRDMRSILTTMRGISGKALDEIYFKPYIGAIPLSKIIQDVYMNE